MRKTILYYYILIGLLAFVVSCEEDSSHLPYLGEDTSIVSFSLTRENTEYPLTVYADSVVFNAAYGFNFNGLSAKIALEDGVEIAPDPATVTDWSSKIDFVVTSANGKIQKTYPYIVHVAPYEKVFEEVAYLTTQAEVDAFGAKAYTKVAGMIISDSEEQAITDLSSLNTIKEIEFNLQIKGFHGHTFNGGFDKLEKVTTFNIRNDSIRELNLPALTEVTNLLIGKLNDEDGSANRCSNLRSVSLPRLTHIKNNLFIYCELQTMEGFSKVKEIEGEVFLQGNSFTSFKGLENITELNYLTLNGMYNINSFQGLENLKAIHSSFKFSFVQVTNLNGLNLEKVGHMNINNCQKLADITALKSITNLKSLLLSGIPNLVSLEGLHNVTKIDGPMSLQYLGKQSYVNGSVVISGVSNLNGLSGLKAVAGDIAIRYCLNLSDYSGLSGIVSTFNKNWEVLGNAYNPTKADFLAGKFTKN